MRPKTTKPATPRAKAPKRKPAPKRKRKPSKGKPGPRSAADVVQRVLDVELTAQVARTGTAVFARIEELARSGEEIPISLLATARLCAEWHTDYLTVVSAMPDMAGGDDR